METGLVIDKDCPFGALFQQIISEMKNCAPLWEDFTAKSTKLHSCLRGTLQAVSAFLDTMQKLADAATNTKGATKEIGTALTRICLRHKALEAKMKTFTSSLMECLILPLQEKLEDWKKTTVQLDKDHAKDYKRARAELKKKTIETARLQKKVRKGSTHNGGLSASFTAGTLPRHHGSGSSLGSSGSDSVGLHGGNRDLNRILEMALRDIAEKRHAFEEQEKQVIRNALLEERSRFALFVSYLKPVMDEEVSMLYELTHVQEAMQQLEKHSAEPFMLPPASEQIIADLKGSCDSGAWSFQTPPSSPSSLGSRKSSMCSISSANSSSSGSAHSPSHKAHHRTIHHPPPHQSEGSNNSSAASSNSSTPSSPFPPTNTPLTTWPKLEDSMQFERAACAIMNERPHTISSAYERGHQRPPLTVYTFQPPSETGNHQESPSTPVLADSQPQSLGGGIYQSASEIYGILRGKPEARPPVPKRCSSLERPPLPSVSSVPPKPPHKGTKVKDSKKIQQQQANVDTVNKIYASNVPDFNQSSDDMIVPQPVYVNMHDLNEMAKDKKQRQGEMDLPPPPPELMGPTNKGESGDGNSDSGSQPHVTGHCQEAQNSIYGYRVGPEVLAGAEFCYCLEYLGPSRFCTLPRRQNHRGCPRNKDSDNSSFITYYGTMRGCPPGRQPTGCVLSGSGPGSRRNSCGAQEKPAPPIRRNSSISASPSRNSPVSMMHQHTHNASPSNNYPTPPSRQHNSSPQHNVPTYPIYIQNPTYSHSNSPVNNSLSSGSQGSSSMDSGETTPHASMESLPPPPSHLVGTNGEKNNKTGEHLSSEDSRRTSVAETVKTLTEKNHHPVSPHMVRRAQSMRQSSEEGRDNRQIRSTPTSRRGSSGSQNEVDAVANNNKSRSQHLIQSLNHKLSPHQQQMPQNGGGPGCNNTSKSNSPNYAYKQHVYEAVVVPNPNNHSSQVHQQPIYSQVYQQQTHPHSTSPQPIYQQVHSPQDGNHLSHHHENNSNRGRTSGPRRFSEELLRNTATFVQNRVLGNSMSLSGRTPPPGVTSKEMFVQTLNQKLSQMRQNTLPERKNSYPFAHSAHSHSSQPLPNPKPSFASKLVASVASHQKGNNVCEISRASRVRQWISSKTVSDPALCRESLLDQIRRGTRLRPTRAVNDRSAPKIHH